MNTPICDFVNKYISDNPTRLHMPGHKGVELLGLEAFDVTEFDGADNLYNADGIIAESEKNAGSLFGANTFYSTEGSSHSIRAMLYLALQYAKKTGKKPVIAAGRNAHKAFLSAAALLDFEIIWLYPDTKDTYLSCDISAQSLRNVLSSLREKPFALYITTPDYLGNTVDVAELANVCKENGMLLLVDNAHGAYLKFLPISRHPIDLGATMCCDSAHKTLSALTGAAYLHVNESAPEFFKQNAKNALALFGSTSPSYLILQSLDALNKILADGYKEKLAKQTARVQSLKQILQKHGYALCGNEPLKITIATKSYGRYGDELAAHLRENGIVCEFYDKDFVVLMFSTENTDAEIARLETVLCTLERKEAILAQSPIPSAPAKVLSVRESLLSPSERKPVRQALGRTLATPSVHCPPAVPIAVCGEIIDEATVKCFEYYGIDFCDVVAEK